VGSLAHLLKNRFYLGEVPYRGEVHRGEHEPILGRDLFEAVQAKRAANAVARQVRLRGAAAILTGRLFDDRGNHMGPTHANKLGVRYRYYVSQAILQNRKVEAGSIARVPAPEVETLARDRPSHRPHRVGRPRQRAAFARSAAPNNISRAFWP
jgi:site-specific DNA recombinase